MIELVHLVKRFGELVAVDGVSLTVPRGELFAMLGTNAAGTRDELRRQSGAAGPLEASFLTLTAQEAIVTEESTGESQPFGIRISEFVRRSGFGFRVWSARRRHRASDWRFDGWCQASNPWFSGFSGVGKYTEDLFDNRGGNSVIV